MMKEDIDYKLIQGKRWFPLGRKYQLITPISHYTGDTIPTGFIWDGGSGVPMRYNSPSARAFLEHDYAFGAPNVGVMESNSKCVQQLYRDVGLLMAIVIAVMFTLLTPALFGYFESEETTKYKKAARILAHIVAVLNGTAILWLMYRLLM